MFASKVDAGSTTGSVSAPVPTGIGGSYSVASNSGREHTGNGNATGGVTLDAPAMRERKLSSGSGGANSTVGMKSKWVKAFKSIKGKQDPAEER